MQQSQAEAVAQAAATIEQPAAPVAPTVPAAPSPPTIQGGRIVLPGGASPRDVYQAAREKREVIRDLIERARNRREEIAGQLREPTVTGADKLGLEKRITEMDGRIIELEKQLVQAEEQMVLASGIPGATNDPPRPPGPPDEVFVIVPILVVMFVLFPVALAWARRLWKRTGAAVSAIPQSLIERFNRLEQNVDAMAIEIERISEGQRFMTKLFAEGGAKAVGQGAQPVEIGAGEDVTRRSGA